MGVLKKGTLVKHGTISSLLPKILLEGLRPNAHSHKYRRQTEASPVAPGVYVGGMRAYNAAYVSFADAAKQLTKMEIRLQEGAVPVVLEMELGEDCQILADEDYVMLAERNSEGQLDEKHKEVFERRMIDDAETVWEQYRTATVIREGGIPPGWIRKVEFPEVKRDFNINISRDASLLALACYSHFKELREEDVLSELLKSGGKYGLTNSATPGKALYHLNSFSVYKNELKRAEYIHSFHCIVGDRLDRLDVPQECS